MRDKLYVISREFFQVTLITYMFLIVVEIIFHGSVSNFFNTNILLIVILCTGVLMTFTERKGDAL